MTNYTIRINHLSVINTILRLGSINLHTTVIVNFFLLFSFSLLFFLVFFFQLGPESMDQMKQSFANMGIGGDNNGDDEDDDDDVPDLVENFEEVSKE